MENDDPERPAKRRAGRPSAQLPDTFEETFALLSEREQKFVRHVIAGNNSADAYRASAPALITDGCARSNSQKMAARATVKHAIKLGKENSAIQQLAGLAYDLRAAHAEVSQLIDEARAAGQYTAVANLIQNKMKLHGLLIERQQVEATALSIQITGVDISRLIASPSPDRK